LRFADTESRIIAKELIMDIKLGISTCLLGEKVRYDGQHKLNHYLTDMLGKYVEWVPVCPEVECGLSVPREAMHLSGNSDSPHLVTVKTGIDHTDRMQKWCSKKLKELETEDLCGFVFKSKSPSSGLLNVKVFNAKGNPVKNGVGLFAKAFTARFPLLPVEEEGRLNDAGLRNRFIDHVAIYSRWLEYLKTDGSVKGKYPGTYRTSVAPASSSANIFNKPSRLRRLTSSPRTIPSV